MAYKRGGNGIEKPWRNISLSNEMASSRKQYQYPAAMKFIVAYCGNS